MTMAASLVSFPHSEVVCNSAFEVEKEQNGFW